MKKMVQVQSRITIMAMIHSKNPIVELKAIRKKISVLDIIISSGFKFRPVGTI